MLEKCSSDCYYAELCLILLGGEIVKLEILVLYLSPIRKKKPKENAAWS